MATTQQKNRLGIHLQAVGKDRVRLYQDGWPEMVFTRDQLDKELDSVSDLNRGIALNEALMFLAGNQDCTCRHYIGDSGHCPVHRC